MNIKEFLNTPVFLNRDIQEVAELNFVLLMLDGFKYLAPRTRWEIQEIVYSRSRELGEHEYTVEGSD
jgi:hypothetical protein